MDRKIQGNYFGTEIDRSWYRRFRKDGFFARGNGELWLDEHGLHFLRKLTRTPLLICWPEMRTVSLGEWHAGKWAAGRPILKIHFRRHALDLSAGFLLSKEWEVMEAFSRDLTEKISKS